MRTIKLLKDGFTLIELLVVIAIIAIITSIGVANLLTAQKQARDAARREIISNVQSAFEQYYAINSSYPTNDTQIRSAFDDNIKPVDPKNVSPYVINWTTAATTYCVCATLETGTGNSTDTTCNNWASTGTYYCAQEKQ